MAKTLQDIIINNIVYRKKRKNYSVDMIRSAVDGGTIVGVISIDSVSPFLCEGLHAEDSADTTNTQVLEPWRVQAQDNDGGYLWCDGVASRTGFFGDRQEGMAFREPVLIPANTKLTITITNRATGTVAGTATPCLRGWSLFAVGRVQ